MAESDHSIAAYTVNDINSVHLKIVEENTEDGDSAPSNQKTSFMNLQDCERSDDSGSNELTEIGKSGPCSTGKESEKCGEVKDQDDCNAKEDAESLVDGTVIHAIEPHPGLLLLNLPNPSQSPSPSNTTQVLVLNNVDKGTLEANVIFDTQRLRLQNLAQASLISATQESIAKVYGSQGQNTSSTSSPYTVQKMPSGQKVYVCDHEGCGRMFKTYGHLKYHRETHGGQKMLKCEVEGCDRRFSWPAHLKYHMKTHLGDRKHKCEYEGCNRSFYVYQRLKVHMRTHTGEKPFRCSEEGCNKSFSTAGNLKNHVRTHTGERPYVCPIDGCGKCFAEHSSLRKHKITHTGSKPYTCDICNKTFSQSGSRNTHRKRHAAGSSCSNTNQSEIQQNSEVTLTSQDHDILEMRQGEEYVLHLTDVEFQQASDSPSHSMGSESVVLSQGVSDHVVTVTTQPVETDNNQLGLPQTMLESEEMSQESLPPHSSPAAVVVMSQPQHTVTMSSQETTFHDPDTQQTTTVEIVYGNELLQSELDQNISHNIHVSNSMSHSISENGDTVEEHTNKDMMDLGAMIETDSSHNNSADDDDNDDDNHGGDLGGPLQLVCDGMDDEQFQ